MIPFCISVYVNLWEEFGEIKKLFQSIILYMIIAQ